MPDRRGSERFEPTSVEVFFRPDGDGGDSVSGHVLDACLGGLAVSVTKGHSAPLPGCRGEIGVRKAKEPGSPPYLPMGRGRVVRAWPADDLPGFAVALDTAIADTADSLGKLLFWGTRKQERLTHQGHLATQDIQNLHAERRQLIDCATRFFTFALTLGMALGGAYLGLAYHSAELGRSDDATLSFWRTMLAALPGLLAVVCGFLVAQRCCLIARIESFLVILKKCQITGEYPREYRGWEAAQRKYRVCLGSRLCELGCGKLRDEEKRYLAVRGWLRKPLVNPFYAVIFGALLVQWVLSLITVVFEVTRYQWNNTVYLAVGAAIMGLSLALAGALGWFTWQIRKGTYSFEACRRVWLDLLNKCTIQP